MDRRVRALQRMENNRPATAFSSRGSMRGSSRSARSSARKPTPAMSSMGSARSRKHLPPLDLERVRGSSTSRSRRSLRSQRSQRSVRSSYSTGSLASNKSDASIARLATILEKQNTQLRKGLLEQERNRVKLETKLVEMQRRLDDMATQKSGRYSNSQTAAEKQLQAYKTIMSKLTKTLLNRGLGK